MTIFFNNRVLYLQLYLFLGDVLGYWSAKASPITYRPKEEGKRCNQALNTILTLQTARASLVRGRDNTLTLEAHRTKCGVYNVQARIEADQSSLL